MYQLSDPEKLAVADLKQQFIEMGSMIEQLEKLIEQKRTDVVTLQGATKGMALLIAKQQGMFTGNEVCRFDDDCTTLTVTPAVTSAEPACDPQ